MSNYKGPYNSFSESAEPIYNQSNILGTVSQSGGVPTGAIIERGSNANGEFVKYADGTLICTREFSLDGDQSSIQSFTTPANLISGGVQSFAMSIDDSQSTTPSLATLRDTVRGVSLTTRNSSWRASVASGFSNSAITYVIKGIAIGRWY